MPPASTSASRPITQAEGAPARVGRRRQLGKRETLFHQGDPATHLFRIDEGTVALEQYLEDGRRQLVELLLPGDICGLSTAGAYSATGIALQPTRLVAASMAELEQHPRLGWAIMRQLQAQLSTSHAHLLAVGRMDAAGRVSALLSRFANLNKPAEADEAHDGIALHIPLTRGEMGDYLGLSLETVCRVMSELERNGVLEIGRHHGDVIIRDFGKLHRLAN